MKNKMEIPEEYKGKIHKEGFNPIPPIFIEGYLRVILPLTDFLKTLNINPNALTTLGAILTVVGAIFFALSYLRIGGIFIVLGPRREIFVGSLWESRYTSVMPSA